MPNMPLYEYCCQNCGQTFEQLVSFSQSERVFSCPNCASENTRKQISTVAAYGGAGNDSSGGGCVPRGGFT
jgi:putative FmdB family regulatory protein